jgi:acetylornithine deacetylase/succinyl-diaminopimelate desuccinylase-like protein
MTRLSASEKINVIPTEAWAELDCRLLPDQSPDAFLQELGDILGEAVEVETLMGFTPAQSSAETGLFRTIEEVTHAHYPEAHVVPSVLQAFTDSHFLRDLGITAYGFRPVAIPSEDSGGVHGNNERISVANVRLGVTAMSDIVRSWVVD